jgi:hypothetical protein
MLISKPLVQYNNFKGLYSKEESGLIPATKDGVYASEIQNVVCDDGTITFSKGYSPRGDSNTVTTFSESDDTYIRNAYSYRKMNGDIIELLWLNTGKLLIYNDRLNKYELLKDYTSSSGADCDLGLAVYYLASTNIYERNVAYFGYKNTTYVQSWNGAKTEYLSSTTNTITKEGSSTWTAEGFEATGEVCIEGNYYAYTGGAGTTTLTGVTPDPTGDGLTTGSGAYQIVNDNALSITPTADILFVYKNRLGLASSTSTNIFLSKPGAPTDFTTTGNGGTITLNIGDGYGPICGIGVLDNDLIVHKKDGTIRVEIVETLQDTIYTRIHPLILRDGTGATNHNVIAPSDNASFYVSEEKEIKVISYQDSDDEFPTMATLSDMIQPTLEGFDFSSSRGRYFKGSYYLSMAEGDENDTVVQYDTEQNTFYFHRKPVSCWFVRNDELYFGSSLDMKVYKWDDTYDDDGGAVGFLWRSGRLNMGEEFRKKKANAFGIHLRMTSNTTVNVQIDYNALGTLHSLDFDVKGDGTSSDRGAYIISGPIASSYGQNAYGIRPYGSKTKAENDEELVEVVAFKKLPLRWNPYDYTVQISASDTGQRAKILSFGFNAEVKEELPKHAIVN